MNKWVLPVILVVAVASPVGYWLYLRSMPVPEVEVEAAAVIEFEPRNPVVVLEPGMELRVKSARVLDGYIYDLCLENNQWIRTQLTTATKDEATQFVIEILRGKTTMAPMIVLRRKVGDYWVVDLLVTYEGRKISVGDLLREKGLSL